MAVFTLLTIQQQITKLRPAGEAQDQQDQEQVQRQTSEALAALFADADQVMISEEGGIQSFSLVFDLTKEHAVPRQYSWWKRIFRPRQLDP
jgi:hypothetical protein